MAPDVGRVSTPNGCDAVIEHHRIPLLSRIVASVALGAAVLTSVAACTAGSSRTSAAAPAASSVSSSTSGSGSAAGSASGSSAAATPSPTPTGPKKGSGTPVQVRLFEDDFSAAPTYYGVAMPIIAYFSHAVTDASVFDKATVVKVNGQVVHGAWYWEPSSQSSYAMEAHYRLAGYWPAHATISVDLPVQGLWAGQGLVFNDSLTLSMRTGAAHIATVDGVTKQMVITSDGKPVRTLPVSLGASETPTYLGTAVDMEKDNPQNMVSNPGEPYYNIEVPWSVRVTYDGEFIHDASWNHELGDQNTSHGCTNLAPADAEWYFTWSQIGDPVTWTRTGSNQTIQPTDGWGDWNVAWATYAKGGELSPTA